MVRFGMRIELIVDMVPASFRGASAVNFIGQYEHQLEVMAKSRKCDGIIAGHVHQLDDKVISGIRYMNCGNWVESAVDGTLRTVHYDEFMRGLLVAEAEHRKGDRLTN